MRSWTQLFVALMLVLSVLAQSEYFVRNAKWSRLTPAGGALVTGRGGFRPGFSGRDWRSAIAEPSFSKRSGTVRLPVWRFLDRRMEW